MKDQQPSRTARQNALFRALEWRQRPARRVADDSLAVAFLSPEYRVLAELARVPPLHDLIEWVIDTRWPCARGGVVVRTRLIDDLVAAELPGTEQLLLFGAGFDSRAYRLAGMEDVAVFEVDHPDTQRAKKSAVERVVGGLPRHVTFVPVTFGHDDPAERLLAAGFQVGRRTIVLWEGVTNYLSAMAVDDGFSMLGASVASGSPVIFTYVDRRMLDGTATFDGAESTMNAVRRVGEPFTFGFDPSEVAPYLAERGFELVTDVAVSDIAARYYSNGRLPRTPGYYRVVHSRKA